MNYTFNITPLTTEEIVCSSFTSTPKIMITFGILVILQVIRAYMHYKTIRRYEKGKLTKDNFITNQYLMGILDISSYPLIVFLLFVFLNLF